MAPGLFSGMSVTQLQTALNTAQQAYLDLSTGQKTVTVSYAQGDGSRSVTFTQTSVTNLAVLIRQLQQQLGMISRARRPIRPNFR